MWDNLNGCIPMFIFLLLLAAIVGALFVLPNVWGDLADSRSNELRAEAVLTQAKSEREHQQSIDWENRTRTWILAWGMVSGGVTLKDVVICVLLAVFAFLAGRKWIDKAIVSLFD